MRVEKLRVDIHGHHPMIRVDIRSQIRQISQKFWKLWIPGKNTLVMYYKNSVRFALTL